MNKALWSRFNFVAIGLLTLLASGSPASALERSRPELSKKVSNDQVNVCDDSELEPLIERWRESYLPGAAALRNCGDSAVSSLTTVMNDSTVRLQTRYLTARLIGQIGSEAAIYDLFAALGNNLPQESDRTELQSIGLKGIETVLGQEENQYAEDSFSNTTLIEVLRSQDLPIAIRLGAMKFVELYMTKLNIAPASNYFEVSNRALTAVVADESETLTMRLSAANTLSELISYVSGSFLVEAPSLEALVKVAESGSSPEIRQGAVNSLMLTYYLTINHSACWLRSEEIEIAHQAVSTLISRPYIDSLWDLGQTNVSRLESLRADKTTQLENRAALNKLNDLTNPLEERLCFGSREEEMTPGKVFIEHIEAQNQPRLHALLVAWARSL